MFPGHAGMNSYPYPRNQTPFTQYYHPGCDGAAPQPQEDATAPPFMYEPWPHNYGYPLPTQCHSCCNHPQYSAYHNFRPPFPQFPPPPAHNHCYGGYPAYPQPYPFSYTPPYTMELPRYEYDKSAVPHCCGCPNHQCNVKEGNNVKIEEHEPDVEPKKSESLVPAGTNKLPYPLLIPPEYKMNKEEHHDSPRVQKPQQEVRTIEQDPNFRQGWFPLDIESIRKLMEGGDGRKNSNQENKVEQGKKVTDGESKDHNKQFPYPIFWMPYEGQGKDRLSGQEERDGGREATEEAPAATFKVVPKKSEHTDNEAEKLKTVEGVGNLAPERAAKIRTIPVKQLEESVPKSSNKDEEYERGATTEKNVEGKNGTNATKVRTIPVKQLEESVPKSSKKDEEHKRGATTEKNVEGKNGANGNSSSPTKKSKLPPICLRVDPPKRRNGNGSSRSPSPPGDKKRQEAISGTKTEVKAGEEKQGPKRVEVKAADVERKVMQEADVGKSDDAKSAEDKGSQAQEVQGGEESKPQEGSKQERKILSEMEAATKIQAAYRGYEVRRWEPLKKLRQIAKVREEATEVKKHIEAYDSHVGSCMEDREKTAVGETIMNLLLKLDTIQGLLPSIRDVRKSVAKDLTMLQERLDSIPSQKFIPVVQETANAETESETLNAPSSVEGSKDTTETVKEPSTVSTEDKSSRVSQSVLKAAEEDELNESTQPPASQDGGCGSENKETLETILENKSGNEVAVESVGSSEELKVVDSATAGKETNSDGSENKETLEISLVNKSEDEAAIPLAGSSDGSETISDKLPTEYKEPLVLEADMASGNEKEEPTNMLDELPREVVQEDSKEDEDMSSTVLTEKPVEGAGQVVEVDSVPAEKGKELHVFGEISQDTNEQDHKEPISEHVSLQTSNNTENLEASCEEPNLKGEELLTIEPESLKPDELSNGAQETLSDNQEAEPSTENSALESEDLPSVEPVSCNPESAVGTIDIDVPVSEVSADEIDTKHSPQMSNAELDSATACLENPASNDEHVQEKKESPQDQQTVLGSGNTEDQFVGSETAEHEERFDMAKAFESEAQMHKDYEVSDKLDKKIIEENEKLRMMLEKLITSGKEQQELISSLSGKVNDLEKKLTKDKKKKKPSKRPRVIVSRSSSKNWEAS